MSGPGYHPEKVPDQEELKKFSKRHPPIPRNSKKKCLGCKDGLVYNGKKYRECPACKGQGFIV